MKKVLLIVSKEDFKDEEYFQTKEVLEDEGLFVETASNAPNTAFGVSGGEARVDIDLSEVEAKNFDAVVFIGGPGALKNLDNEISYKIANDVIDLGNILAAICIAPVILAKAGVLKEKKATVWSSEMDKSAIKIIEKCGAIFVGKEIVEDGNVITANGPDASQEFGSVIVEKLVQI